MSKTRDEWIKWFTSDQEIQNYHVGDDTVEFRGYVLCVEGTCYVRTTYDPRTPLFKMYASNGKSQIIKITFWGKNATKWSPMVSERSIIRIQCAKAGVFNNQWRGSVVPTASTELTIQANSVLIFEAEKFLDITTVNPVPVVYEEVLLKDIAAHEDKEIKVQGWIKVPFRQVTYGGGSRGCGTIVDHEWRIRVIVRLFTDNPKLVLGTRASVSGVYTSNEGSSLTCDNIKNVEIMPEENILSEDELFTMGFITPKRKIEDSTDEPSTKRSPFDE
ncbi:uncharacterized protein LOC123260047 [Cotesia glomerata]|uniref:Uncharacterized protein n=1 Tax=Cotesia glomerata TaxID=32391 RepID=A0AAV7I2A2_COTGL|nr:uncharacterized protein LOC123260047 [Cotesia glomerata]XP_044576912.1 uncharacterized protein LOC123260047 [Cotesia glomerata]KAH0540104.1 hypothetical protein KQX54_012833 [Cotesia glomerata]